LPQVGRAGGANPPNLERAQCALERIVKDDGRASAVIDRIGIAIKREPIRLQQIDLNEVVREVVRDEPP